jgi:uncharacterized coiled-coil DUF342 family protein
MEREYKKLQDKHRDTLNNEYNLQTTKEHLEASMRVMQEDIQRMHAEFEQNVFKWKRERQELIQRVGELGNQAQKIKETLDSQKGKCRQYKEKLRLANKTIKTLTGKVV